MRPEYPTFSIVIETANLQVADVDRLGASLDSIAAQDPSPAQAQEVVLLEDGTLPDHLLQQLCQRHSWLSTKRVARDSSYIDQKMFATRSFAAEVLVHADSDCLYQPGWLASLLETCAAHPEVGVLCGETTVEIKGPFTLALGLVYFFPRYSYETTPGPTRGFFANCMAIRKWAVEKCPFPEDLRLNRGSSIVYSRALTAAGIPIWREPRARSLHAPPEGLGVGLRRLFWTGRDSRRLPPPPPGDRFLGDAEPYGRPGGRIRKVVGRLRAIYRQQPAMLLWLPIALPIALAFVLAFFIGVLAERLFPTSA